MPLNEAPKKEKPPMNKARVTLYTPYLPVRVVCLDSNEVLEGPLLAVMRNVSFGLLEGHTWTIEQLGNDGW